MKFYWIKTHSIIKKIFSKYVWNIQNNENKVYLTFDDGPTPEITHWVLEQLEKYNAKATFFCIGKNIEKHPEILQEVIKSGHSVGNHTFNHLNGWKTADNEYVTNTQLAQNIQSATCNLKSNLFRPPYGKIKPSQSKKLQKLGYKIIMWDVLSADFDTTISKEKCLENVLKNVKSGSVIVFHDSAKAYTNLEYALPKVLETLNNKGFIFDKIE
jgi:peptidoglycan-N-acetylglucosamine deacetylase